MRFSEERVYQAVSHTSNDFVAVHMKDHKVGMQFELGVMFEGIHDAVEAGIWDGRYEIDYHRNVPVPPPRNTSRIMTRSGSWSVTSLPRWSERTSTPSGKR